MFKFDGPVFDSINKLIDFIVLGTIWLIMCIPVVTIGASTTAAYYVAFGQLDDKDGYVFKRFFRSFRMNFVQATIIFFISIVIIGLATVGLKISNTVNMNVGEIIKISIILMQYLLIFEAIIFSCFGYSLLSKIEFTTANLIKAAFLLSNNHLITAICNSLILLIIIVSVWIMPVLVFISGGTYIMISAILMKITKLLLWGVMVGKINLYMAFGRTHLKRYGVVYKMHTVN